MDNYSFSQLIDGNHIKNLMESFFKITKIPSTLIDLEGNILKLEDGTWVAAGWQDICLNFHRKNPETLKNCIECDTSCTVNLQQGKEFYMYKCRNGLVDVAVPVYIDDIHVANLFTGQFLFEEPDIEFFRQNAKKYGFNEEYYLKALSKVPIFTEEYIIEGIDFLKNLAIYIGESGLKQKKLQEQNQKLLQSENKFRTFTEGMINGLIITRFGKIEYANPQMNILLGFQKNEQLIGKNIIDFMTPECQRIARKEMYKRQKKSDDVKDILEYELIKKDGSHIICEVRVNSIECEDKIYGLSIYQDVTQKKNAKTLLKQSEERYHSLFENAAEGIFLMRDDTIIESNHRAVEIFNGSLEDIIDHKPWELSPEKQPDGSDSLNRSLKYMEAALNGEPQRFEWLHNRMDGTKLYTIVSLNRVRIGDEYLLQAIVRDITDRKTYELKLKRLTSELKYRLKILKTINELSEFISVTDKPWGQVFNKIIYNVLETLQYPELASVQIKLHEEKFSTGNLEVTAWKLKSPIRVNAEKVGSINVFYNKEISENEEAFLKEERFLINNLALKIGDLIENRQIRDELILERDRLKVILDSMEDGVYICSKDYDVEYANPSLLKQFGPVQGKKCYQYLHNRSEICPWCVNEQVFKGETVKWEWHSDIAKKIYDVLDTPLINPDGSISKLEFIHDITDIKNYQKELSLQNDILQAILDNAPIMITYLNEDGIPIYVNKKWEEKTGWTMDELAEIDIFKRLHPDPEYRELVKDFISKANGKWGDFNIKTRDHKIIDTTWSNVELSDGSKIGIGQDITQRKLMERELRESEEKYRRIVENAQEGIWTVDSEGFTNFVNTSMAEMLGYTPEEMKGKLLFSFMEDKNVKRVKEKLNLIKSEVITGKDFVFKHKDGRKIFTSLATTPLYVDGEYIGILALVSDITRRKLAEDEIKSSLKEKEVLLSEVHHRVKNNMQIISSLLNLQTQQIEDENIVRFYMDTQSRVRAMAMIQEKLYESHDFSHISFANYVENLISQLYDSFAKSPAMIKMKLDLEDVNFNIETAIPLGLVINELVSNIFKHAFDPDQKGHFTIKLDKNGEKYILTVEDNGKGFPSNIDFKNTESLGLQLVNTLVSQIDGVIELDQSSGTRFIIEFEELKYRARS
ncbi:MAG: PAS domain S-box protein [Methanomicrobiales archaeon]